jgi:hypothetical protein
MKKTKNEQVQEFLDEIMTIDEEKFLIMQNQDHPDNFFHIYLLMSYSTISSSYGFPKRTSSHLKSRKLFIQILHQSCLIPVLPPLTQGFEPVNYGFADLIFS